MQQIQSPKTIVITGASSGIGAALAQAYAQSGVTLGLIGRDVDRLEKVAESCRRNGASVLCGQVDVTDHARMAQWLIEFDRNNPIELLIVNAGICADTGLGQSENGEQTRQIFSVNVMGMINTLLPIIPLFKERKKGQIALVSSLAGFRGLPNAPAYSATKGIVRLYGEGLRAELSACNIALTVVCPGFVKTPLTDKNDFYMPFLMSADKAAQIIRSGLQKRKKVIVFPFVFGLCVRILALFPAHWGDVVLRSFPHKES